MTGRGIYQVLAHPCDPKLHEDYVASAKDYVSLAEKANGAIPRHAKPAYVWGVALDELDRMRPDVRIINLETAITRSDDYARKGINYRMSPENADCLSAANIDCCCPSADDLGLIRRFEKGGSGSSGLEFKRPAADAASGGLRWLYA